MIGWEGFGINIIDFTYHRAPRFHRLHKFSRRPEGEIDDRNDDDSIINSI